MHQCARFIHATMSRGHQIHSKDLCASGGGSHTFAQPWVRPRTKKRNLPDIWAQKPSHTCKGCSGPLRKPAVSTEAKSGHQHTNTRHAQARTDKLLGQQRKPHQSEGQRARVSSTTAYYLVKRLASQVGGGTSSAGRTEPEATGTQRAQSATAAGSRTQRQKSCGGCCIKNEV